MYGQHKKIQVLVETGGDYRKIPVLSPQGLYNLIKGLGELIVEQSYIRGA